MLLGAVKEEKGERNHAGTANGFRESASDHAVILRIQGRRHPALPSDRRRISGESNPRTGWIKKTTVHFFKNNMKITSHHLMITSLDFRSNLRLIPLLLLFLGYSRGMPHVLRFGKNLFVCLLVCLDTISSVTTSGRTSRPYGRAPWSDIHGTQNGRFKETFTVSLPPCFVTNSRL